jgi:hypothetical protein
MAMNRTIAHHDPAPGGPRQLPDAALLRQCRFEAFRGSGPGGQKRNKTSSAVRITHLRSGLSAVASESRSQHENRARALRRLRHRLALDLREAIDPATFARPDWLVELIGQQGGLKMGPRDERYPAVMGLVLDVLAAAQWSVSTAAGMLGVSTANFVGFLQADVKLLAKVNQMRAVAGLRPLGR